MSVNYSNTRVGSFIANDVTARDAIPAGNKFEGMRILLLSTGIEYQLACNPKHIVGPTSASDDSPVRFDGTTGQTTQSLASQHESLTVVSDGTSSWFIV